MFSNLFASSVEMSTRRTSLGISGWAEEDQPRYKLASKGAATLTNSELLSILIGSGSVEESAVELCRRILHHVEDDLDRLAQLSLQEIIKFKGIGKAKAVTIAAALELGKRRQWQPKKVRDKVISSKAAYQVLAPIFADKRHEEFWVIYLDRANQVITVQHLSLGGVAIAAVDPKLIFKKALEVLASGLVLGHNHPSGQLKPSQQDLALTKKICAGGDLLDIKVLDHIIVGDKDYFSFADEQLL